MKKTVIIADDHKIVLDGLKQILEDEFNIVGLALDGMELVRLAKSKKPHVIVVDASMPKLNGIEATRQIKAVDPDVKIIVLTMHNDVGYAIRAFDVGADGYIVKHAAAEELITAIREVLKGRTYITPHIAGELFHAVRNEDDRRERPLSKLTPRQREVLQLLAEGHSAQEAADILCISRRTVEFHKYNIMETVGAKNNTDLISFAIKNGIVTF
jgi:DNA-binding NarL/FixJ family response regulator